MRLGVLQYGALALVLAAAIGTPAIAKAVARAEAPCQSSEPAPPVGQSQAELRDGTLVLQPKAQVAVADCLVLGKPAQQPPYGVHLNYNFALFARGSRLLDVNGTVSKTGPFAARASNPFTMPLNLSFPLAPGAAINKHLLLGQVDIAQCNDQECDEPDIGGGYFVTAVLNPNATGSQAAPARTAKSERGCLDPVDPKHDPELRQVSVLGESPNYGIYACLVSSYYTDFQMAGFQVEGLKGRAGNMIEGPGGNTRMHIRRLVNAPPDGPKVLTLFGVDIPAKNGEAAAVRSAHITTTYFACPYETEKGCTFGSSSHRYPVRYYTH